MGELAPSWPLIGFAVTQIVTVFSAYYGLKAAIAQIAHEFQIAMVQEKADRTRLISAEKSEMLQVCAKIETYVNDLTHRVTTLETGQDGWTKDLRQRTHDLSNEVQTLVMKVAILERERQQRDQHK